MEDLGAATRWYREVLGSEPNHESEFYVGLSRPRRSRPPSAAVGNDSEKTLPHPGNGTAIANTIQLWPKCQNGRALQESSGSRCMPAEKMCVAQECRPASSRPDAILAPHFRQTARRAVKLPRIVVTPTHDTTQFEFGGQTKRDGLGHLIRPSAQRARAAIWAPTAVSGHRPPVRSRGLLPSQAPPLSADALSLPGPGPLEQPRRPLSRSRASGRAGQTRER